MGGMSGRMTDQRRPARSAIASDSPAQRTAAPATGAAPRHWAGIAETPVEHPNRTGLPDGLKSGIETLSGVLLDDVRVHRNSIRPSQHQAHAFAKGSEIHLSPGQERHLPHEVWHVVQQKQGRVDAKFRIGEVAINHDRNLEAEADAMGANAIAAAAEVDGAKRSQVVAGPAVVRHHMSAEPVAQLNPEDDKKVAKMEERIALYESMGGVINDTKGKPRKKSDARVSKIEGKMPTSVLHSDLRPVNEHDDMP